MSSLKNDTNQLVCFKLANEEYALNIDSVQEVLRLLPITCIPQVPEFCLGVINFRSDIIAVFDLRKLFGLAEKSVDSSTRLLTMKVSGVTAAFLVDEILDNVKLEMSQIDSRPNVKMKIEQECVKAIGQLEKRMIIIIDVEKTYEHIFNSMNH